MHKGVGLIICNKAKTRFFVQQKDENYPVKKWALCYSFWGGKIEDSDASYQDALKRELSEEIKGDVDFISSEMAYFGSFMVDCDKKYEFNLFELVLGDEQLQGLQSAKFFEGYGVLVSLNDFKSGKWIWCLEQVVSQYLNL